MAPEEAINLLDSICAQVNLNREMHLKVQEAIKVLKQAIPATVEDTGEDDKGGQ